MPTAMKIDRVDEGCHVAVAVDDRFIFWIIGLNNSAWALGFGHADGDNHRNVIDMVICPWSPALVG